MNLLIANIEVNGKKYRLQHPGNREWLKLKKTLFRVSQDEIDIIPMLDYFFAHCCFPEIGDNLNLDTIDLTELEEVWSVIAPRFFRGDLATGYCYPVKSGQTINPSAPVNPAQ
jgi:hypothetical protein